MIVAGVGCRRGTEADELERVVRMALELFHAPADRLRRLRQVGEATAPAFLEAARRLGVNCGLHRGRSRRVAGRC